MTEKERAVASNLFSALDAKHKGKLDHAAIHRFMTEIPDALDFKTYTNLVTAVYRSKDFLFRQAVDRSEFMNVITAIKNRDPKDFAIFLQTAKTVKPLKTGSACLPYGLGDSCPKHNTWTAHCQPGVQPIMVSLVLNRGNQSMGP